MVNILLIFCLSCFCTFNEIQEQYYGKNSTKVASINVDELSFTGDSLDIAINRIARANYKHQNYRRGLQLIKHIDTDHRKLQFDTMQLKALLLQNIGRLADADSLYKDILSSKIPWNDLSYRIHLNYAELHRLQMRYDSREQHLLQALSYAEGREHNKTLRVLVRHYMNVLQDFQAARQTLAEHPPMDSLTDEGKAGYLLVKAELAEAQQEYKRSKKLYNKAQHIANEAGFVSFQLDAVDGAMRSDVKASRAWERNMQWVVINSLLTLFFVLIWFFNRKTKLTKT